MKNCIPLLLLFLFTISASSQNPRDAFPGRSAPPLKIDKLITASSVNEVIPIEYKYLQVWEKTIDYISVEIMGTCAGISKTAFCEGGILSAEQKEIMNKVDLGTDINIGIRFKYKDSANNNIGSYNKIKEMSYTVTVVPEFEAQYETGFAQMGQFFKENVLDKMPLNDPSTKPPGSVVTFAVNEKGEVVDAKIYHASTDPEMDRLVVEALGKMPKWLPARNSKGEKVKQQFKLSVPFNRGGC